MRRLSPPVPTGRLAVVVAVASVAVLALPVTPVVALVVVDLVVLVVALVDWGRTAAPSQLGFEREVPAVVALGGQAQARWRVGNAGRRGVDVVLADQLAPSLQAGNRRAGLTVPPGGWATATTTLCPSRRGRFEISEVTLRVTGPWGLAARQGRRQVPSVLRVYPPLGSVRDAQLRIDRHRVLEIGLRSARALGGGTDFEALREYGGDDDSRRIDWSATARADKPIVRTYRSERNQRVLCLLDCGRTMAGRVSGVPRLEHAMDGLLALSAVTGRLGDRCGLLAFDDQVRAVVPPIRQGGMGQVAEAVYRLEPALAESDYRAAFLTALSRFRRRALLVVLSELSEAAVEESLLPALPLVVRDHVVVLAAVRDPVVAAWAQGIAEGAGGAGEAEAAYRQAAATSAMAARRRTAARLRGLGVTVVDSEPGRLAAELTDTYLHLKATGRL